MDPLSLAAALVGAVGPLLRAAIDVWIERRRQRALKTDKLEKILDSPNLVVLGAYLDNDLGAIDVGRYANDADARQRVDRVLGRLNEFLGPSNDAVDNALKRALPMPSSPQSADSTKSAVTEAAMRTLLPEGVLKRLDAGDDWAALVFLRTKVQQRMRDFLRECGESVPEHASAGKLLNMMRHRGILDPETISDLERAVAIMNRAAHGVEVSSEEVRLALRSCANAIPLMSKSAANSKRKTLAEA